jgi:flavin reductase (DIM6/NTAB) family NADH-FMN oxidoreductase RutF
MPDPIEEFQRLVAGIDYPMFVVTVAADGERSGCLVGFATQASMSPPRMLVLLSKLNHTLEVASHSEVLVVHFLDEQNRPLASIFGEETGDEVDKFAQCSWDEGPAGTPILTDAAGWMAGRVLARFDAGDHVAHLLDVVDARARRTGRPLSFQDVRDLEPGHPA